MSAAWSTGLIRTLNDSKQHIISSNIGVVIHDKYPKAKHHYLVLPRKLIATIFDMKNTDVEVLDELHLLALNIIEVKQLKTDDCKIGFHAQPSMQQLHLHVISKDFISDCLKTKKHWNSFNTSLFLPYEDVYEQLKFNGCVKRLDKTEIERLHKSPMVCNQCTFIAKNIPDLKEHLKKHWQNRSE